MNTAFNAKVGQCTGCGAPLEFKIGTSRVIVCQHCQFAVARGDRGLENLGKMADLATTGARLTLQLEGKWEGTAFRLVGRLQYQWKQGVWDEWYVSFNDGRWGWIAETQGRYYISFRVQPRPVPPLSALRPGKSLALGGIGAFVVTDLKQARYLAASGELPEIFKVGDSVGTADLTGRGNRFATLDYGESGREDPELFLGKEVTLEELHLLPQNLAAPPSQQKIKTEKLICPTCNGPLELKAPDHTLRVTCPHCNSLLDTQQGVLKHLAHLEPVRLPFVMGSKPKFFGKEYLLIGWMERACTVEGEQYTWEEFLLYNEKDSSFRFLVCSEQHWSFVQPVAAGEIEEAFQLVTYRNKLYKKFSANFATVTRVYGEFYWEVYQGEQVQAVDYISPPEGLSKESNQEEVSWSHAIYLTPQEVQAAFAGTGRRDLPSPMGVGAMQPNPHRSSLSSAQKWAVVFTAIAFILFLFFSIRGGTVVFQQTIVPEDINDQNRVVLAGKNVGNASPSRVDELHFPTPQQPWAGRVYFSKPFRIPQARRNLRIQLTSNVSNSWAFLGGAVINQATQEYREFFLESSYYSGISDGESWSEGDRNATTYLSSMDDGEYVMRMELGWNPKYPPPKFSVELKSGVSRFLHFFLVLLPILGFPFVLMLRMYAFEKARWNESNA